MIRRRLALWRFFLELFLLVLGPSAQAASCLKEALRALHLHPKYIGEEKGRSYSFGRAKVHYLSPQERSVYVGRISQGLVFDTQGRLFQTTDAEVGTTFVLATNGRLYLMNDHQVGLMHHSTLSAGEPVLFAGEVWIKNGRVQKISGESGHYLPGDVDLVEALLRLKREGLDLSRTEIKSQLDPSRPTVAPADEIREGMRFLTRFRSLADPKKRTKLALRETAGPEPDEHQFFLGRIVDREIIYHFRASQGRNRDAYISLLHELLEARSAEDRRDHLRVIFRDALRLDGRSPALSIAILKEIGYSKECVKAWTNVLNEAARRERPPTIVRWLRAAKNRGFRREIAPYVEPDHLEPEFTSALKP